MRASFAFAKDFIIINKRNYSILPWYVINEQNLIFIILNINYSAF